MIRVLLVDDSALARRLLARMLPTVDGFEIVGEAADAYVARDRIVELRPDVVVLDLEMPRMDGISFLRKLMHHYPIPVVVCSSLTRDGGDYALGALDAGAVAVVCKASGPGAIAQMTSDLTTAVRAAALAGQNWPAPPAGDGVRPPATSSAPPAAAMAEECRAVVMGASTGGTVAVESIVRSLPGDFPPLVIVQHLPQYISGAFARRLDQLSPLRVEEAQDGVVLRRGVAVVAPGDRHVWLEKRGGQLVVASGSGAKVNGHRPSVDVLFHSAAEIVREHSVGVLLTGMGRDGAAGLLAMRTAGAHTLVQDEATCTVWGMPKAALDIGAADEIVPLPRIAARLSQLRARTKARAAEPGVHRA